MREEFEKYISENKERISEKDIKQLINNFEDYFEYDGMFGTSSRLYDFLCEHYKREHEYDILARTIKNDFSDKKIVFDVGAGEMCHLSRALAVMGYTPTAIDPNIRLTKQELENYKIFGLNEEFICDFSAGQNKGTDIKNVDLVVGLRPCGGTEHIIRQCIEYDKPFKIVLCHCPAENLQTGEKFILADDWFKYLAKISNKFDIQKIENRHIASNTNEGFNYERVPEL